MRSTLRAVVSNTVISLIGQAVTWSSTLLLTVAYGRFLGDAKFGELYFAISVVLLIGFPLEFGFNQQITRDVARAPDQALPYLCNTVLIKVALWAVLYGLLLLLCWGLHYPGEERSLVLVCGLTLLSAAVANTVASVHYALGRVIFPVVGNVLEKGLAAVAGFFVLKAGAGVQTMALILLGGSLVNAAWQSVCILRLVGVHLAVERRLMRDLIRTSIPFLTYGVLGVIYYRIDTVLLSLLTTVEVVGWYGAAYRLFDTLVFLPSLIITPIMLPIFSRMSATSERDLSTAISKVMNLLLLAGMPIATTLIVAAPNIIGVLYHRAEFAGSIPALQALAPGLLFLYVNSLLANTLISTKRERKIPLMAAIALVFNLSLNLVLIPHYQQVGAAITTSLTELLLLCLSIAFLPSYLLPRESVRVGVKTLVASGVMAVAILVVRDQMIGVILPIAALTYLSMVIVLGAVPREDLHVLYGAVRNKVQRVPTYTG